MCNDVTNVFVQSIYFAIERFYVSEDNVASINILRNSKPTFNLILINKNQLCFAGDSFRNYIFIQRFKNSSSFSIYNNGMNG